MIDEKEPPAVGKRRSRRVEREKERWHQRIDEPTCRCHQNPFIGALGIQEPVILCHNLIIFIIIGSRKERDKGKKRRDH